MSSAKKKAVRPAAACSRSARASRPRARLTQPRAAVQGGFNNGKFYRRKKEVRSRPRSPEAVPLDIKLHRVPRAPRS